MNSNASSDKKDSLGLSTNKKIELNSEAKKDDDFSNKIGKEDFGMDSNRAPWDRDSKMPP
jgi:hypothetical protein